MNDSTINLTLFPPVKLDTMGALINNYNTHRYKLWRIWDDNKPMILFIGLNPSRADHIKNDATITRCERFAKSWGYGGIFFANLYSFRTPYVTRKQWEDAKAMGIEDVESFPPLLDNMHRVSDKMTDQALKEMIALSEKVVCAYGAWDFTGERAKEVLSFISQPYCMGLNANGSPKHPLYLSKETKLQLF